MKGRLATVLALAGVAAACFALRSLGLEEIFGRDGTVALDLGDGAYHARLVAWSFANFPSFLTFDPYLAGPNGGAVPWPPLFDLLVAGAARVLGVGADGTDAVLAWAGPLLGVFAVAMVYAAARSLADRGTALGAAALYASFGITNEYGTVGNGDHHAFVATLAAIWLALSLAFVAKPSARTGRIVALAVGLALVRAAMLTGWNGSLLYVALADGTLMLACTVIGGRRLLVAFGSSAWLSAALVIPVVRRFEVFTGGPWSSTTLSNLHVAVAIGLGAVAFALVALEAARPASSARARVYRLVGVTAVAVLSSLSVPALRAGFVGGLRFLTLQDAVGAATYEQMPLFPLLGRAAIASPWRLFGWLVYLVTIAPLMPLIAVPRESAARVPALLLVAWAAVLGVLALTQMRYANDFAAPGAICFALLLTWLPRYFGVRAPLAGLFEAAVGLALIWPCAVTPARAFAPASWHSVVSGPPPGDPLLRSVNGTLVRFAQSVRAATPETPGYLDTGAPEYGMLCNPNIGHTLRHYARRPVVGDNFWDFSPVFERFAAFGDFDDEAKATALLDELRIRYLVTIDSGGRDHDTIMGRLEAEDGVGSEARAPLARFRLITEGPRGGYSMQGLAARRRHETVPYKLFEVVRGATLTVPAPAATRVFAEVTIATPSGRHVVYRVAGDAAAGGTATLVLPYATQTSAPAHPTGPWRVGAGDRNWTVGVDDAQVQEGATIAVGR